MGTTILEEGTERNFKDWLDKAKPGDRLQYHKGALCYEREGTVQLPNNKVAHVYYEPLHSLAQAVWSAYRAGKVILVQQREDYGVFRYFAIKRRK